LGKLSVIRPDRCRATRGSQTKRQREKGMGFMRTILITVLCKKQNGRRATPDDCAFWAAEPNLSNIVRIVETCACANSVAFSPSRCNPLTRG
jgi:hypothetical protein